jgi:hypothetical protein
MLLVDIFVGYLFFLEKLFNGACEDIFLLSCRKISVANLGPVGF